MCRGASERIALKKLIGPAGMVSIQRGDGLGAALESAFRDGVTEGCKAVAVLAPDSPTLPPAVLREAFAALDDGADLALGPSEDGGYYLLAARGVHSRLFRDMPWSTGWVASETLERCSALGLSVHILPVWYDVDEAGSLARLYEELPGAARSLALHTRCELAMRVVLRIPQATTALGMRAGASV